MQALPREQVMGRQVLAGGVHADSASDADTLHRCRHCPGSSYLYTLSPFCFIVYLITLLSTKHGALLVILTSMTRIFHCLGPYQIR